MRSLVLLVVLTLAQTARADDREEARREFDAGQAADRQKDWQTAVDHYLRANDLVPHPFAIYNIAVDYEHLGKLRDSAEWYQKYLETAPDSPDREKVMHILAEMKSRPASLSIRSLPPGAQITLDHAPAGTTPIATKVKGGAHHVSVDLGTQHDERDVDVEYGEPADVMFTFGGAGGTLNVTGTPAGAYVAVDNITIGVLPATAVVAPGTHQIRVTAYGYTTYEGQALVTAGQPADVNVVLPRALGTIDTNTTPGPKLPLGYVVGASGGADLSTNTALILAEFGARALKYEGVIRVGRVSGGTGVDFLFRYSILDTRVTPIIGVGYSYADSAFGYMGNAGLRWDVARGEHAAFSLIADFGLRWYSGTDSTTGTSKSGVSYPLELSLEVTYR